MMRALRVAVAAAGISTIASAILIFSALNSVPSPFRSFAPRLAAGEDRRADALLRQGEPDALQQAAEASRSALAHAPYDTTALLRIAMIDLREHDGLTAVGVAALGESYRRVPLDRSVALWRISFGLENWDRLPVEIRTAVQNEVRGIASEPGHRWPLRARLARVTNRQGRVVAALWQSSIARNMDRDR